MPWRVANRLNSCVSAETFMTQINPASCCLIWSSHAKCQNYPIFMLMLGLCVKHLKTVHGACTAQARLLNSFQPGMMSFLTLQWSNLSPASPEGPLRSYQSLIVVSVAADSIRNTISGACVGIKQTYLIISVFRRREKSSASLCCYVLGAKH